MKAPLWPCSSCTRSLIYINDCYQLLMTISTPDYWWKPCIDLVADMVASELEIYFKWDTRLDNKIKKLHHQDCASKAMLSFGMKSLRCEKHWMKTLRWGRWELVDALWLTNQSNEPPRSSCFCNLILSNLSPIVKIFSPAGQFICWKATVSFKELCK